MNIFKSSLIALLACAATYPVLAQNGSNSSYSRFGLGLLSDQSQSVNKGMGGIAQGLREGMQINMQNPASYSALSNQNFVLDLGMSLQNGNYNFGTSRINIRNTSFDYAAIGFKASKNIGMSVGVVPFSQIGYEFNTVTNIGNDHFTGNQLSVANSYSGEGGIRQLYYGVGWMPIKNLSLGMNISYVWGEYRHYISQLFYDNGVTSTTISGLTRKYSADIQTYKLDFGAQYSIQMNKENTLNLGTTVGLGHNTQDEATLLNYLTGGDSIIQTVKNAFELPLSIAGGATWNYANRLVLGADYSFQKWGNRLSPTFDNTTDQYIATRSLYNNRHKFALGAEYTHNPNSRKYVDRIRLRAGGSYTTPYHIINGNNGPSELSLGAGVGLPITNKINNRSTVNVSLQWIKIASSVSTLPTENYMRINVGVTFNERWFMKWKIE